MTRKPAKRTPYQTTTLIAVVVLLIIVFVITGYFFVAPKTQSSAMTEFLQHRELWNRQQPDSYRYVVDPDCFCTAEYREHYAVTETNGSVTARFERPPNANSALAGLTPPDVLTIDKAFALVEQGIDEAGHIEVAYDDSYGFPTDATIYWSEIGADDFFGFQIYSFEITSD